MVDCGLEGTGTLKWGSTHIELQTKPTWETLAHKEMPCEMSKQKINYLNPKKEKEKTSKSLGVSR